MIRNLFRDTIIDGVRESWIREEALGSGQWKEEADAGRAFVALDGYSLASIVAQMFWDVKSGLRLDRGCQRGGRRVWVWWKAGSCC